MDPIKTVESAVRKQKQHPYLSVNDPRLPRDVGQTLSRLMEMGFNKAGAAYFVETSTLAANHLSLEDLRSVLRARRLGRNAVQGRAPSRKTAIIDAAGQSKMHTMFRLQVELIN